MDRQADPGWALLPLTHITGGLETEDIILSGEIAPTDCKVLKDRVAYLFYGRPAYRLSQSSVVKLEETCPYCFVFSEDVVRKADKIFAFDTGAMGGGFYKHVISEKMDIQDFSLEGDLTRPGKLIAATFKTLENYLWGDTGKVARAEDASDPGEFHARAYLGLLNSKGRNEPDDRVGALEVTFRDAVSIADLKAIVVPHTLWSGAVKTPWLKLLADRGVAVRPYKFIPGRHPEYYHALMEHAVMDLYEAWGVL